MNDFSRGALFALCLVGFGKGMYELGKMQERVALRKALKNLAKECATLCEKLKEEETIVEEAE